MNQRRNSTSRDSDSSHHSRKILARKEREAREAVFPNLRNTGILARALMIYVAMVATYAIATTVDVRELIINFAVALGISLPVFGAIAITWVAASAVLRKLAYWQATLLLGLVAIIASALASKFFDSTGTAWRGICLSLIGLAAVLIYFDTLGRALSPAVTEARLQALQARIRPHFLFNAINGVLGVLRAEPKRAEAALMDMAELFRALMRDNKNLASLYDEVVLTRQYLDLEKLRLGSRLNVEWKLDKMPGDALVPPLVLQPIAENAVYHGIEPTNQAGTIEIEVIRQRNDVVINVRNPFIEQPGSHHGGNKMAMSNIRERLALHFDAESRMTAGPRDGRYHVQIVLPYRKSGDTRSAL
jgi:two-component system, LytTR family, sensor histidine kinase AlgZ